MIVVALKLLVMPPLCLYLAAGAGLLLWRRRPRTARLLVFTAFGLLVLLSIPTVAIALQVGLQGPTPDGEFDVADAEAIVVLGADGNAFAPEYAGSSVGALTLERLRYAALLAKRTGLPVLVSGGALAPGASALAIAMSRTLELEFGVPARWVEARSADTRENARFSAEILRAEGIQRVVVVTHAWHAARALEEFRKTGLSARAAGTGWRRIPPLQWSAWLPSSRGLRDSCLAVHEWIGLAWYALS